MKFTRRRNKFHKKRNYKRSRKGGVDDLSMINDNNNSMLSNSGQDNSVILPLESWEEIGPETQINQYSMNTTSEDNSFFLPEMGDELNDNNAPFDANLSGIDFENNDHGPLQLDDLNIDLNTSNSRDVTDLDESFGGKSKRRKSKNTKRKKTKKSKTKNNKRRKTKKSKRTKK